MVTGNANGVANGAANGSAAKEQVFLVFGKSGWIGGLLGQLLKERGLKFEYANARLEDRAEVIADLERVKPTHVLNAAGLTGRPNVDWCEDHKLEVIRVNVLGMLNLADLCDQRHIHLTTYATGCIFHYDKDFPQGSGKGFKEEDTPNFTGSYYSKTKAMVEDLLKEYPNCLILRVRMPIVADLTYPRNFITKIIKYDKAQRNLTGIMNYTNPGAVSHNEILQMYKEYIDPDFTWSNFSVEEQAKVIVAARSNNLLDTKRIEKEFPQILSIHDSLKKYVFEPNAKNKPQVLAAVKEMRGR